MASAWATTTQTGATPAEAQMDSQLVAQLNAERSARSIPLATENAVLDAQAQKYANEVPAGQQPATDPSYNWFVANPSLGGQLNAPIISITATADGKGYYLLGADGGVFTFGDAHLYGSMGSQHLNAPINSVAVIPGGGGYWMIAGDGGVFSFGAARFYGSLGATLLNAPVIGMASTPNGRGYTLVGSDGGVVNFGDSLFYGSLGSNPPPGGVVSLAATPDNGGYYLLGANGGAYGFGPGAPYLGGAN